MNTTITVKTVNTRGMKTMEKRKKNPVHGFIMFNVKRRLYYFCINEGRCFCNNTVVNGRLWENCARSLYS